MALQVYSPIVVTRTILNAFFRYRGLVAAPRGLDANAKVCACSDDDVISDMAQFFHIRLDAVRTTPRGKRDWVVFFILASDGKYAHHGPELRKLLAGVSSEVPAKNGRLDEVIIVVDEEFFSKKNLTDEVLDCQRAKQLPRSEAHPDRIGVGADPEGVAPFYNAYAYFNFVHVLPEHTSVAPHRLMAPTEVKAFLERERLSFKDIPVIDSFDPPIVWNGGREGQVVEIIRDSQTASRSIYYRRIEYALYSAPVKKKAPASKKKSGP
jgi:DNA-directed RNA polymerase subunit H (RpoH/RPB5)